MTDKLIRGRHFAPVERVVRTLLTLLACLSCSGKPTSVIPVVVHAPQRGTSNTAVPTIAMLRTTPVDCANGGIGCCVFVHGYHAPGDGGGGPFCYHADAVDTDDHGTIILPLGGRGRWLRTPTQALSVYWFGARCNGVADDTASFTAAINAANRSGATVTVPRGQTCRISQLDFGQASTDAAHRKAFGVTIAGSSSASYASPADSGPSTILVEPLEPVQGACETMTDEPAGPANGGIVIGPNVRQLAFEDLQLKAGPSLDNCIVNVSAKREFGDPYLIAFRRVRFLGNRATAASVFLHRSSWLTFDHCFFAGSVQAIKEDFRGRESYSTNPVLLGNLFYRANQGVLNRVPLVEFWDVAGGHIVGNRFENGPWGIYIGQLAGGTISDNWFNGENERASSGEWIDVGCSGCVIQGNHLAGGFDAIRVRGRAGTVAGNYFIGQNGTPTKDGTPLFLDASNISVVGNYFHGGTADTNDQIAIVVGSGTGYQIGSNYFAETRDPDPAKSRLLGRSIVLAAGTTGVLSYDPVTDTSANGMSDRSGRWTKTFVGSPARPRTVR